MTSAENTVSAEGDAPVDSWRELFAFLVAPWAIPLVFVLPFESFQVSTFPSVEPAPLWLVVIFYGVYAIPIGYAAEMFLGLPAWWLFRKYQIRSVGAFVLGGCVLGWILNAATQVLVGNPGWNYLFNPWTNPYVIVDSLAGLFAASVFRLIVFTRPAIQR